MLGFTARDILVVGSIFTVLVTIFYFCERRDYRRKAAIVVAALGRQCCSHCGGELGSWDGRFRDGDTHFYPGGYWPRIFVTCARCHAEQVLYLDWYGNLFSNDIDFPTPPPDQGDATVINIDNY